MVSYARSMNQGQPSLGLADQFCSADEAVRLEAAQSLRLQPDNQWLLLQMLGDESWRVRQAAVANLAQCPEPAIAPLLLDLLRQHHHNPGVVDSVLRILMLSSLDTTSLLLECATDADIDLRIYAMTALGEQRDARALTGLMQGLADADINVRYHAIESLGRQRHIAAVEPLVAIAESHEVFLAFPALDALARIGDGTVVPRLLPLLSDHMLALPTIETLSRLGDPTVIPALAELLEQPDAPIETITQAIAQICQTALANGSTALALTALLEETLKPETAEKLIPVVRQFETSSVKPDSIAGLTSGPGSLFQASNTGAIT